MVSTNTKSAAAGLMSALSYFDAYCTANMPTNLIQAQRDYFGAHTYQRIDKEGIFHTEWENKEVVVNTKEEDEHVKTTN